MHMQGMIKCEQANFGISSGETLTNMYIHILNQNSQIQNISPIHIF